MIKMMGFGLAIAVLFDAFVVRMAIVPRRPRPAGPEGLVAAALAGPAAAQRGRRGREAPQDARRRPNRRPPPRSSASRSVRGCRTARGHAATRRAGGYGGPAYGAEGCGDALRLSARRSSRSWGPRGHAALAVLRLFGPLGSCPAALLAIPALCASGARDSGLRPGGLRRRWASRFVSVSPCCRAPRYCRFPRQHRRAAGFRASAAAGARHSRQRPCRRGCRDAVLRASCPCRRGASVLPGSALRVRVRRAPRPLSHCGPPDSVSAALVAATGSR